MAGTMNSDGIKIPRAVHAGREKFMHDAGESIAYDNVWNVVMNLFSASQRLFWMGSSDFHDSQGFSQIAKPKQSSKPSTQHRASQIFSHHNVRTGYVVAAMGIR